jgi:hypothetical protein
MLNIGLRFSAKRLGATAAAALALALGSNLQANQNVSLQWNANTGTNTQGYYLYFGNSATNYSSRIDVGNNTMATVTGLTGKSMNYFFAVTAYDSSRLESPPSNQAQFTTSSNAGPTLQAVSQVNGIVNNVLIVTNNATDPDKVTHTLTYSLVSAPPTMHIDTNSGRLYWKPGIGDGGTTNAVTVQVVDNFGLYSQQTVNVGVSNAVQAVLSPVVVGLGNAASVQLSLICTVPVTNVTFVLDAPANRVSNVTLSDLIPSIATVTQTTAGATHSTVTVKCLSGQTLSGSNLVAQINFNTLTGLPSMFAANVVSTVAATESTGQAVPTTFGCTGDVVLVGTQPLVRSTLQTNRQGCLALYGPSGKSFQIQSSANPLSTNGWSAYLTSSTLGTNLTQIFSNVPPSTTPKFFRILAL